MTAQTIYGVDSYAYSQVVLPVLRKRWGHVPAFWFRYAGGAGGSTNPEEVAYLLGMGCRVGFVYNVRAGVEFPLLGTAQGEADALALIAAIKELLPADQQTATPAGFRDIEGGQEVDLAYLLGFCLTLERHAWPGGLYYPAAQAWYTATSDGLIGTVARRHRLLWCSSWTGFLDPPGPEGWCASASRDTSSIVLWQFAGNALGDLIDANLATPELVDLLLAPTGIPLPVVPPAPERYHVAIPGSLKVAPSHTDARIALDPKGNHLRRLEPGTILIATGAKVHTDDVWLPCRLDQPDQVGHGFYPFKNLI